MAKVVKKHGKLSFHFGVEQGTQEWLELRSGLVTCSNASTLLTRGKNFCLEANAKAMERITPNGNSYAERGHVIENEVRELFNQHLADMGLVIHTCAFITNSDYPEAGYSPDGLIAPLGVDNWWEAPLIPLEVKAYNDVVTRQIGGVKAEVRTEKHLKATLDLENVPVLARAQCQMEMLITGSDQVCLLLANPDAVAGEDKVKLWWIKKDQKIQDRLIKKLSGAR